MKRILSAAVVAALVGGTLTGQAAVNTKTAKKATVKKVAKKKEAKKEVMAVENKAVATEAPQTSVASSSSAAPSPLSFVARLENEYAGQNLKEKGVRTGTSYVYLQATYKIDSTTSFRVNQEFSQSYAQNEQTKKAEAGQAAVGDTYIQLAKTSLFQVAETPINSYVRAYLPTSISTREKNNQYLELRGELSGKILDQGALSMSAHTHARAYLGEVYTDADKVTKKYRLRNYLNGNYNITSKLYFLQQLGVQHTFMKDKTGGQPGLYAYSELGYSITDSIGIEFAAYSLKPMNQATSGLYNSDEDVSLYYLNGSISF